jgi:hypothetical protein
MAMLSKTGSNKCQSICAGIFLLFTLLLFAPARSAGQSCLSSSSAWTNSSFAKQTGSFTVSFDAMPSVSPANSIVGVSSGSANEYTDLAASIRFNPTGTIDARNGSNFTAASSVNYSGRTNYHFTLNINVSNHTYSAYVLVGSSTITLGTNMKFRTEQASVSSLSNVAAVTSQGAISACNISMSSTSASSGGTLALTASTTALTFGSVAVSSSSQQNITLTNSGSSNVTISKVSVSGAGFTAGGGAAGLILSPNQTATVGVTFSPSTTGTLTGSVTVTSNAKNSPNTIALSGSGVTSSGHSVTLSWNSAGSSLEGYNVYIATNSGGPFTRVNGGYISGTSFTDSNVVSGDTYYFVVTSISSSGNESAYSAEVKTKVP